MTNDSLIYSCHCSSLEPKKERSQIHMRKLRITDPIYPTSTQRQQGCNGKRKAGCHMHCCNCLIAHTVSDCQNIRIARGSTIPVFVTSLLQCLCSLNAAPFQSSRRLRLSYIVTRVCYWRLHLSTCKSRKILC